MAEQNFGLGIIFNTNAGDISRQFVGLNQQFDLTGRAAEQMTTITAVAIGQLAQQIQAAGTLLSGVGASMLSPFIAVGKGAFELGRKMESQQLMLKVLLGNNVGAANTLMQNIEAFAEATPFTAGTLTNMMIQLKAIGIDINKVYGNYYQSMQGVTKEEKKQYEWLQTIAYGGKPLLTSAGTIIADLASTFGIAANDMDSFMMHFTRFLSTGRPGLMGGMVFPQMKPFFEALGIDMNSRSKKAGGKTGQALMDGIQEYLKSSQGLGMAARSSETIEAYMQGFSEMPRKFFLNMIGFYDKSSIFQDFKRAFSDLYRVIQASISQSPEFMDRLKAFTAPVIQDGIKLVKGLTAAFLGFIDVVKKIPTPIMTFLGRALAGVGITAFLGGKAIIGIGAILAILNPFLMLMANPVGLTLIANIGASLMAALPIMLGTIVAIGVAVALWKSNFMDIQGIVEKISVLLEGLFGATGEKGVYSLSEILSKQIIDLGLADFFIMMLRVKHLITEIGKRVFDGFMIVADSMTFLINSIIGVMNSVLERMSSIPGLGFLKNSLIPKFSGDIIKGLGYMAEAVAEGSEGVPYYTEEKNKGLVDITKGRFVPQQSGLTLGDINLNFNGTPANFDPNEAKNWADIIHKAVAKKINEERRKDNQGTPLLSPGGAY